MRGAFCSPRQKFLAKSLQTNVAALRCQISDIFFDSLCSAARFYASL